jgi:hypothetical protein
MTLGTGQPPPRSRWRLGLLGLAAAATLVASALLVLQTARYMSFDFRFGFLVERPFLTSDRLWSSCFYLHVLGGMLCLVTAPFLLWNGLARGRVGLHRAVGRLHAVAALGWTGPTGLYLAPFAKGGLAGQLGFLLLGVWFVATSLFGIVAIRRGHLRAHVGWMVRSYTLLLSAVTFRGFHRALHELGVDATRNYVASTWASLVLAIVSGELLGRRLARSTTVPAPQPTSAALQARTS